MKLKNFPASKVNPYFKRFQRFQINSINLPPSLERISVGLSPDVLFPFQILIYAQTFPIKFGTDLICFFVRCRCLFPGWNLNLLEKVKRRWLMTKCCISQRQVSESDTKKYFQQALAVQITIFWYGWMIGSTLEEILINHLRKSLVSCKNNTKLNVTSFLHRKTIS